ncbi:MAG: hypothetical protein CL878_01770 [Dehalococcoidia bacterium]|nr:hypothetical protein [Dehalococcoidia bacterium]
MPRRRDANSPQLGIVATTLTGIAIAGHLLLAAGGLYDYEVRQQTILSTLLPSARPAFQPIASDIIGYWFFIVTGLMCAIGVTRLWQRWEREHDLTPARATALAAKWLLITVAGLSVGWALGHAATAGRAEFILADPQSVEAALVLGSLAVSIAICGLFLVRTRSAGTADRRSPASIVPLPRPVTALLLVALIMLPFLAPAYLQSIAQCGGPCLPDWQTASISIGAWLIVALIAGIGLWRFTPGRFGVRLPILAGSVHEPLALGAGQAAVTFAAGSAVAFALLWVPDPWRPVGDAFGWDRLFHWSYTVVGPTLGVLHGSTPGVDIVSHHGIGLPIGIGSLTSLGLELTYANLVRVQIIGTVLVFGLLAVLTRLLFGSILWAGAAFLVALGLQFGGGWAAGTFVWWHPQLGFLRNPVEIVLLLVIVLHHRSGARRWLAAAAAVAAASLWWVTDMGLINTLVLAVYVVSRAALASGHIASALVRAALAASATVGAVAVGFLVLTLATVGPAALDPPFWQTFAEGPRLYGSVGLYARAVDPFGLTTAHLYLTPALYVAFAAGILATAAYRRAPASAALLLALAAWGLLLYQHFIRGSEPSYWFRHSLPWAIIVTYLLARASSRLTGMGGQEDDGTRRGVLGASFHGRTKPLPSMPGSGVTPGNQGPPMSGSGWTALWLVLIGCVVLTDSFLSYPNALWGRERGALACWSMAKAPWCIDSSRARPDLPEPQMVAAGVGALQRLVPTDVPAAVISPLDVLYLYLAERGPFWRHLPLDHQPPTPVAVERAAKRITDRRPTYVFFDRAFPLGSNTALLGAEELAEKLSSLLRRDYVLVEYAGNLEVWQRRAS